MEESDGLLRFRIGVPEPTEVVTLVNNDTALLYLGRESIRYGDGRIALWKDSHYARHDK